MKDNYYKFTLDVFGGKNFSTHVIKDIGNMHGHEFVEVAYVIKGISRHVTPLSERMLSNDSIVIVPLGRVHAFDERDYSNAYHRDILISIELFEKVCNGIYPEIKDKIFSAEDCIVMPLADYEREYLEDQLEFFTSADFSNDKLRDAISFGVVAFIISLFIKNRFSQVSTKPDWYVSVMKAIKNPNVLQGGIPELVKEVGYSHGHLCRLIKDYTGKKLLDFLTEYRMMQAAMLIMTSSSSLIDIAASVGYESFSHFICVFEKFYKISPYKYKREFKDKRQVPPPRPT